MPTLPPHSGREIAESFGADAERYDRARPRYPAALVERVLAAAPGRDVLDVGIGTGIVARQFRQAGARVLGVDADPRMADTARRLGCTVEVARFEEWEPAGRTFDAVVSGQTWHWLDPVAAAGAAGRALRPRGRLAVFWNVFRPAPEVAAAFADVHRRVMPDAPMNIWESSPLDLYGVMADRAADGVRQAGSFGAPERWRFDWARHYSRDEWLDQIPTLGGSSRLPAAVLDRLLSATGAAIDALGGGFTMPYATVVVTAARAG